MAANWHPVTMISHALDYALWGMEPWGHHLSNVVLHSINTALVLVVACLIVVPGALSALSVKQTRVWHSPITLWSKVLKHYPESRIAHNNLGLAYERRGMVDRAIGHYTWAVELQPDYMHALGNLGNAYLMKGETNEAIGAYLKALEIAPEEPILHFTLAKAYHEKGLLEAAIEHYSRALELWPDMTDARSGLERALDIDLKRPEKRPEKRPKKLEDRRPAGP